ncbi:lipoprotein [Spiroplasma clarkii]|uniref:Lipoprotein n=1 Tax=Spiroplasma clarkii TaxID=2139 RepID=A0A2K8KNX3_9MOLU|nr:lipoprotein [Spiroplasma clarkii]ATX70746.1 hypothetical protein SCLAR_v1c04220 [Spiroplasma clarkii]
MKKILSLFGALGMVATTSTTVIACTTEGIPLPKNPSTKEEIINLINIDAQNLLAEMDDVAKKLDEVTNFDELSKILQTSITALWTSYAFNAKIAQYLCLLEATQQEEFFNEHELNLEEIGFSIYFPEIKTTEKIKPIDVENFIELFFNDEVDDFIIATDKTKKQL